MTCEACGGEVHPIAGCKLCVMFASGETPGGHLPACWAAGAMKSEAMAVHPDQVPEAMARDKRHGVPTEYTRDGRPIFTDRGHRKAYLRSYGVHDKRGGYGD
jgi:hypothetical protein